MCQFFSFVGDGFGNYRYLDWEYRKNHLDENCDSHTFILTEAKIPSRMQDRWSNYEYDPFTKKFTIDYGIEGHNHSDAEAWVSKLNFKTIIEPLIIKEIVDPFKLEKRKPTQEDIEDLEKWILVWNSVKGSMWSPVWSLVWSSMRSLARNSVGDSVWNSVRDLVESSIWSSVRDSVYAYYASFFDLDYGYDFSPLWRLWNRGLMPSYDGTTWRLHSGRKAEVVYKISKEN